MIVRAFVHAVVYIFVVVVCFIVGVVARGLWVGAVMALRGAVRLVTGRRKAAAGPPLRPAA